MIIRKLEVKGSGKETASVEFEAGLNVIAGASDTGKSYITKCFQFIFGSEQPPKQIEQSKGYTHLEVTIELNDGKQVLLSRELAEKADVTLTELNNDNLVTVLKPNHKGNPNLSSYFLNQLGLDNKTLVMGLESMRPSSLTLRIFEKILLVDEERIISERSPFGKGQNTEKTLETSFIKTLLTGEDDSSILACRDERDSKEKIGRKILSLQEFLDRFFPQEEDRENTLEQLDTALDQLESAYEEAERELNELVQANNNIVRERNYAKQQVMAIFEKLADDNALYQRFGMLENKYLSDRERLEANSEAVVYMEHQRLANCPLCGSEIIEQDDVDIDVIVQANIADIRKIDVHLNDLNSTQESVQSALDANRKKLEEMESEVERLDELLAKSIVGKLNENRAVLKQLDLARSKFRKERDQEKKRQEIFEEIGKLQVEHDKISDSYNFPDFSKQTVELGNEISQILKRWGFPNGDKAFFDIAARDIVINGKPRSHYGKGYRAICFSSILLGLMEYLSPKGRHPGFVILDSPLTTYKKQDENQEASNNEVFISNNLIYAFYRDLCDYYSGKQVIVLDNQEPDEDLHQSMNYIHFSGNDSVGRYGFFPLLQSST